jgi:C_GCAxxG_C_C family probable redox protein
LEYEKNMSADSDAVKRFLEGNACSQAVLSQYCELFDLDQTSALKIASGFGAGMQMGKTCGAVTGAYMVLGLKFGTEESGRSDGRKDVYRAVVELTRKFEERNGTTDCRDLLGCDISTAEGSQIAKEKKLFTTVCPRFVKDVSELLDAIIAQD